MEEKHLRGIQLQELEILLEFRRLCEEHGLRYYLTGGTLLGAVRHHGFIPWDDDIDVLMPRSDYLRFAQLCERQILPPGYRYQSTKTDREYSLFFAKLKREAEQSSGATKGYIDIFPLDKCPDQDWLAILFFKGIELCTMAASGRTDPQFVCGYRRWYMRFLWKLLTILPLHWIFALQEGLRKFFGAVSSGKRLCNVGGLYGFPREVCQAAWFSPETELEFENCHFSAPGGWHELLSNMYGDYMTPPDQADRRVHFL